MHRGIPDYKQIIITPIINKPTMSEEIKLLKGNEAIAHAAIRYGADGYFGYPITPQSEILETLEELMPWETTGMVVLQAESELAAINMVYGGAACGKAVLTSSSSPGISLKQEAISYIAAGELPALIVNVMRGGPGLGTIQPSQADYFQATKGGGHGDYKLITLAPWSVQEMADFVGLGFDLAFKYPGNNSCRRNCRTNDGKSTTAATTEAKNRRGTKQRMPVGNNRQTVVKKKKHYDHIRARPGRDGNNKHPSTKKI